MKILCDIVATLVLTPFFIPVFIIVGICYLFVYIVAIVVVIFTFFTAVPFVALEHLCCSSDTTNSDACKSSDATHDNDSFNARNYLVRQAGYELFHDGRDAQAKAESRSRDDIVHH